MELTLGKLMNYPNHILETCSDYLLFIKHLKLQIHGNDGDGIVGKKDDTTGL